MKRLLTIGLMLASAFALTNCAEEITAPVQEDVNVDGNIENITPPEEEVDIPFEVFANLGESPETKTYNWGNGTYWHKYEKEGDAASDQISVFHHDGSQFTHNNAFTIQDVATSLFTGSLRNKLGNTNDWYFLYPYNENYTINSSSGTTATTAFSIPSINIGSATYTQDSAEGQGKKHIAGKNFPMFGFVGGLEVDHNPDIKMNHLAAIAAVKVVNLTDDIITLNNAELHTYKTVVENNKSVKKTLPVVGNFKVGFDNDGNPIEFTAVSGNSNQVKIQLDEPVPVKPNASYTLYFAVSPFKTTLQNLTLYINGSEKIPVSADEVEFEAGKITTLKLEVNPLSTPLDNDALGYTFTGRKYRENGDITKNVVTFYNVENGQYVKITEPTATVNINNSQVPIYVLGGDKTSIIRIEGKGSDLVNVLPVTFYASRWNDKPTAMRLKKVDAYWKAMFSTDWLSTGTFSKLDGILGISLDDGITPDDLAALGFGTSKLTFSGMIPNCSFNGDDIANSNVLMIDEERTSKVFDNAAGGNIETYLKIAGNSATMEGLIDIFNGNLSSSAAKSTGQALYDFIYAKIKNKVDSDFVTSSAMSIIGVSSSSALMQRLRDTQFYVEIETCPFPGHTDQNPIVVWGFDANIPTSPN